MAKTLIAVVLSTALVAAQTRITPPKNKYTPAQDVELGQQAAAEARQQLPIMRDEAVSSYAESIGRRLVQAVPAELRHPEFRYSFEVVNVRDINAFALPGGPMFINRGMIEAAHNEGEVAGVMAHELSHVVLRHGTAQASAATPYEIGTIAGAIIGAIIGGRVGSVVAQGTQFGLGTAFMRFSRAYEHDADIEGSQIMARAGYDPRDMASMFKTIEAKSGGGGPEWLSDHPNPGNRYEYIIAEARSLRVENAVRNTAAFEQVQAHLRALSPAPTTEQATRNASRGRDTTPRGTTGTEPTGRVEPPSNSMTGYRVGSVFRVRVPSNWRETQSSSSVTFAPQGAYGQYRGENVFTHGMEMGISRNESHDLQTATDELIDSLGRGNPNMSRPSGYSRASIGNRQGLRTILSNISEVTGREETVTLFTTLLRDGSLFYAIGVAPRDEFGTYQNTFQRVVSSIQLTD
jgi:Zn-dependent protease with chaperone function